MICYKAVTKFLSGFFRRFVLSMLGMAERVGFEPTPRIENA